MYYKFLKAQTIKKDSNNEDIDASVFDVLWNFSKTRNSKQRDNVGVLFVVPKNLLQKRYNETVKLITNKEMIAEDDGEKGNNKSFILFTESDEIVEKSKTMEDINEGDKKAGVFKFFKSISDMKNVLYTFVTKYKTKISFRTNPIVLFVSNESFEKVFPRYYKDMLEMFDIIDWTCSYGKVDGKKSIVSGCGDKIEAILTKLKAEKEKETVKESVMDKLAKVYFGGGEEENMDMLKESYDFENPLTVAEIEVEDEPEEVEDEPEEVEDALEAEEVSNEESPVSDEGIVASELEPVEEMPSEEVASEAVETEEVTEPEEAVEPEEDVLKVVVYKDEIYPEMEQCYLNAQGYLLNFIQQMKARGYSDKDVATHYIYFSHKNNE